MTVEELIAVLQKCEGSEIVCVATPDGIKPIADDDPAIECGSWVRGERYSCVVLCDSEWP